MANEKRLNNEIAEAICAGLAAEPIPEIYEAAKRLAESAKKAEKRLIDANEIEDLFYKQVEWGATDLMDAFDDALEDAQTVDAVEVVHGRWALTANEEYCNYRWNVTAECSECHHSKGEIYAGFFSGFPKDLARDVVLDNAEKVKLDNYCPHCGAKMDGGNEDEQS